jgi:hypothetical protein
MAIWQFPIALVPQRWLDAGGLVESFFSDRGYDTSAAWQSGDASVIRSRIDTIFPEGQSWGSSHTHWGSYDTDDVRLSHDEGSVKGLSVRFDLRNPNIALFNAIISAAKDLHLAIVDLQNKRLIPLDVQALLQAAGESDAAHFAKIRSGEAT